MAKRLADFGYVREHFRARILPNHWNPLSQAESPSADARAASRHQEKIGRAERLLDFLGARRLAETLRRVL